MNEFWTTDLISRTPDNQLQHAWMRCYAPKPARAVEYCARLAPQIQEKFHFSTAYCDVHTAVAPWDRVDYDARVPGAGTMSAVFYAFGEIMLLQKQAWHGPVYSEGNHHAFYCGLTDGNYGQDQAYHPAENPWLVDFDLRSCTTSAATSAWALPTCSTPASPGADTPEQKDAWLDRFLAATVAFGHPGFLVYEGEVGHALRSYYMLQQLHSRYCLASPLEIRYADAQGQLLDTSAAVASGTFRRSQVVTRYSDGTVTAANGHRSERMRVKAYGRDVDLPPNGFAGWAADGSLDVWSRETGGGRADYADTPAYLFIDGRHRFARAPKAAGTGIGVCRILPDGYEILLHEGAECGFAIPAGAATALAADGRDLGPAGLRTPRADVRPSGSRRQLPPDQEQSRRDRRRWSCGADGRRFAPVSRSRSMARKRIRSSFRRRPRAASGSGSSAREPGSTSRSGETGEMGILRTLRERKSCVRPGQSGRDSPRCFCFPSASLVPSLSGSTPPGALRGCSLMAGRYWPGCSSVSPAPPRSPCRPDPGS